MRLHEFQAKRCFAQVGITIPASKLLKRNESVEEAVLAVGLPCMLKAQVLSGGRGKAGLVQKVDTVEEAKCKAKQIFDRVPDMEYLLLEQMVDALKEVYLSVSMDPLRGEAMLMGCIDGGVEIEKLASEHPEKINKEYVDLERGVRNYQLNDFCFRMGLEPDVRKKMQKTCHALLKAFSDLDADLAEINPLFITKQGELIAGDGKLSIDDNSLSRHPEFQKDRAHYGSDMEYEAAIEGIPYIEFSGDIALMVAGAGLANTVYDLVSYAGGTVSNYLEFGGPNYKKAEIALRLCMKNHPKAILIVTFGTIARADVMAEGIAAAYSALQPTCPIVLCLRGTGEEKVAEYFEPIGLVNLTDTEEAVRKAVAIVQGGKNT